jgi:hypothetical protein
MKTRSTYEGEHKMLPYYEKPCWTHLSELYNAENHNLMEIYLEEKLDNSRKWEGLQAKIQKKRMHERYLFSSARSKTPRAVFMEDTPPALSLVHMNRYMDLGYVWLQRIRFRNRASRVHGVCDGLVRSDFLSQLDPTLSSDDDGKYLLMLIKPSFEKNPEKYRQEIAAYKKYFRNGNPRIADDRVVLVGRGYKLTLVSCTDEDHEEVGHLMRSIRKVKKWAPLVDLAEDIPVGWYPNMKLPSAAWDKERWEVAHRVGDITMLWSCNDAHRQMAHAEGIVSWRDERFCADTIGFTGTKADILDRILRVNRSSSEDDEAWIEVSPRVSTEFPELDRTDTDHLFIDVEYIDDFIYMIGVYDPSTHQYTSFWTETLDSYDGLFERFSAHLQSYKNPLCWYWYAEKKAFTRAGAPLDMSNWRDLWEVARCVGVKNAFDFSLKSFVRAFYSHGRIPFRYEDLECQNGADSIDMALQYYTDKNPETRTALETYNRYDCEAMWYILKGVRENK